MSQNIFQLFRNQFLKYMFFNGNLTIMNRKPISTSSNCFSILSTSHKSTIIIRSFEKSQCYSTFFNCHNYIVLLSHFLFVNFLYSRLVMTWWKSWDCKLSRLARVLPSKKRLELLLCYCYDTKNSWKQVVAECFVRFFRVLWGLAKI